MMRLADPGARARRTTEPVVPMINVVFLLLVFFLITAVIAPPDPLPVVLPEGPEGAVAEGETALFLAADGRVSYGGAEGEAVYALLPPGPLEVRADAGADAQAFAALAVRLRAAGVTEMRLVTVAGEGS